MTEKEFDIKKEKVVNAICNVLIEKNKRYGNSALEPLNIFYKGNASTSIAIRLDDKISRIKNSTVLRKNDMFDILGYLLLYSISMGFWRLNELQNADWEDKVDRLRTLILDDDMFDNSTQTCIFDKQASTETKIDKKIELIRKSDFDPSEQAIRGLIILFIKYFIENNITDFTDLID